MASVIRLRRKKNDSSSFLGHVALLAGEPFYDAEEKHLYVGNNDFDVIAREDPKIIYDSVRANIPVIRCHEYSLVMISFDSMTRIVFNVVSDIDLSNLELCVRRHPDVTVTVDRSTRRLEMDFLTSKSNVLLDVMENTFTLCSVTVCTDTTPPKNNLIEIPPNSSILDFSQHQNRLSYSSNSQIWESDGIQVCHFRGRYKEHIAEITDLGMYDSPAVEFQIGEDPNNVFHHVVNHVASAKGLTLDADNYGEKLPEAGTKGRVFFVELTD